MTMAGLGFSRLHTHMYMYMSTRLLSHDCTIKGNFFRASFLYRTYHRQACRAMQLRLLKSGNVKNNAFNVWFFSRPTFDSDTLYQTWVTAWQLFFFLLQMKSILRYFPHKQYQFNCRMEQFLKWKLYDLCLVKKQGWCTLQEISKVLKYGKTLETSRKHLYLSTIKLNYLWALCLECKHCKTGSELRCL